MGSRLEARDKGWAGFGGGPGYNKAGQEEKPPPLTSRKRKFHSLVDANQAAFSSQKQIIELPSMTSVTSLWFSSQTERRKPHEAHSTHWQEEVSKPRALWVMQFTYCAGWGFGSSLILKHKKKRKKKGAHSSVHTEHKEMRKTIERTQNINTTESTKDAYDINNTSTKIWIIFKIL